MIAVGLALASGGPPPIVGGIPASPGEWPDAVAVFTDFGFTCTGTLIAPDLVLTAGHCITLTTHVRVGATDHAVDGEQIAVAREVAHPDSAVTFDVGLLELAAPASAAPRGLLVDCLADFLVDGASATAVGFGRTDPSGQAQTTRLMRADLPIGDADCSDPSRGCRPLVAPGGELIAGGEGVDSCTGDSGGPLYLRTSDGRPWLAGVVSRGAYPATNTCGDGGIYVRVDAVRDWIEQESGRTLPRPDCAGLNRPPQATAARLEVTQGRSARLPVEIEDPEGDAVTVEVELGPERGFVDAELVFHAEPFQLGPDLVRLKLTDAGQPPQISRVDVPIAVSPAGHLPDAIEPGGRGCSTQGSLAWTPIISGVAIFFRTRSRRSVYRR